jgi:hypothetical protein
MKILQVIDEETGALMASVPINGIQDKVIASITASLVFRGLKGEGPMAEGEVWRVISRWALEQAWEADMAYSKKFNEILRAATPR